MTNEYDPVEATHALWRVGILIFKLWPQQLPIYNQVRSLAPHIDEAVLLCARQFGKSHLGTLLAIEDCLRFSDRCILIVGPTLKQTREIVTPRLRRIIQDAPPGLIRPSKSEGKWYIGSSELVMGGMDVNSSAQRGKTVQNVYIEEIVDSRPDDYIEALRSDIGPALTHSDAGKMIYLTTLPKIPDHPFITETMSRAALNEALYVYTIDDNKALSTAQYEAAVRRAGGRDSDSFKREYLCQIIRDRSIVVIPDFNLARHVSSFVDPYRIKWQVFIDWGGVRDLTVAQVVGYDFLRGKDLVSDELWFPHNTPTEHIVGALRNAWWEKYQPTEVIADVPGQIMVDLKQTHNFDVRMPPKSDWEAAVNNLGNRFTLNQIEIHPRCKLTIQTCQSGTLNKNRTDFERTHTLGHCDALASLMYAVRALDRTSPYAIDTPSSEKYFIKPKVEPNEFGMMNPVPKSFGLKGVKRFG